MTRTAVPSLALVALLVAALSCSPFPQPTPTPTITPTTTASPTPTLRPTPTLAPTPTPATTTRTLTNGSTEFTDHELGYSVVLPAEWIVLNLSAQDVEAMIRISAGLNPELAPLLEAFASTAAQGTRFIALHPNAQALQAGYVPNIAIVTLGALGLPLDFLLEGTARSLEAMIPGARLISHERIDDLNGAPAGRIEMRMPVTTAYGTQITARGTWVLVEASGHMLQLTLTCEERLHNQYKPFFEGTIQSLKVTAP